MILQTTQLSPSQKASIETMAGRRLQDQENVVLCRGKARVASAQERGNAARQMRIQLYLLDPSERRMSIEECAAALMKDSD